MHIKKIVLSGLSATVLLSFGSTAAGQEAKQAKSTRTTPIQKSASRPSVDHSPLIASMTDLAEKAKECNSLYAMELELLEVNAKSELAWFRVENPYVGPEVSRVTVQLKVIEKKEKEGWKYRQCAANTKESGETLVGKSINPIRDSPARLQFITAIAQLLTAVDAVGKKNFDDELSKYTTQLNVIRLVARSPQSDQK